MNISLSDRIKKTIKLQISYPNYRSVIRELQHKSEKRAILIGAPIHTNLGDHLIASECFRYVKTLNFDSIVEIPEFVYELFPEKIELLPTDTIFILGGGWMGNSYEDEIVVEEILSRFQNNRIIILPQTIHFSENGSFSTTEKLKTVFKHTSDLIVCTRDKQSYDLCCTLLDVSQENCYLLPDMALLRLDRAKEKKLLYGKTIIYSLRDDLEKKEGTEQLNDYRKWFTSKGYTIVDSSTALPSKTIKFKDRDRIIQSKIDEYSCADLVITDRLHSMVFSLIAGTKCIAIDNSTHKVMGVKNEWLKDFPGVMVFNSASDVTTKDLEKLLSSTKYPEKRDFTNMFTELTTRINSSIR